MNADSCIHTNSNLEIIDREPAVPMLHEKKKSWKNLNWNTLKFQ